MEDEYEAVARGKLKLKKDAEILKKKKKKKRKDESKEKKKMEKLIKESVSNNTSNNGNNAGQQQSTGRQLTKAELSFKKMQEKMQKKRILEKAALTHKQRVEKFNEHLDGLTEHFDIPKVSWTK